MKSKTIAKILAGKHAAWCRSITDEAVRKVAEQNTIITGGAIVSLLTNEPVNDYDIYLRTPEAAHAIAAYYVKELLKNPPPAFKGDAKHTVDVSAVLEPALLDGEIQKRIGGMATGPQPARVRIVVKSAGIAGEAKQNDYQYFERLPANEQAAATEDYVGAAVGEGQITDASEPEGYVEAVTDADEIGAEQLEGEEPKTKEDKKDAEKRGKYRPLFVTSNAITLSDRIQIVIRFTGEPGDIHRNYDFQHVLSSWTSWNKQLTLDPRALECILTKELRYIGSLYPIASLIRTRKFIKRGYSINAGQYVKMAWQVSQLDLSNPLVLEDQLVGVDSAYFHQVIGALKAQMAKRAEAGEAEVDVDGTYLLTLIDKIF